MTSGSKKISFKSVIGWASAYFVGRSKELLFWESPQYVERYQQLAEPAMSLPGS